MTYVIHGANGAQGAPVLASLLAAGHSAAAVSRTTAIRPDGAETRVADLGSIDQLAAAYAGAEGVFVHLPLGAPDQLAVYARAIVAALDQARPARVVISTSGTLIDDPQSPLQAAPDPAIRVLMDGVAALGISAAMIAPRLFLDNLLLPPTLAGIREEGVLRYPLPPTFPVSWSSHRDTAAAAVELFARPEVTGVVATGHLPGLVGDDLAAAFAQRLGRDVRYEEVTPVYFGAQLAPVLGEGAAAGVTGLYAAMNATEDNVIPADESARELLGLEPTSPTEWLATVGF